MDQETQVIRLSEAPHLLSQVIDIIEKEFSYDQSNSVLVDFYPLLKEQNFYNNFILIKGEDKVIGHVGTKPCVYMVGENHCPILHMGGIAIDSDFQGQGHFKRLFGEVLHLLEKRHAFILLWSEKQDLYQKFGFFPVGGQIQPRKEYFPIEGYFATKFHEISPSELEEIKSIYKSNSLFFFRPEREWDDALNVSSCNLFIKKINDEIISYYVEGKGQDLNQVIHEFGIQLDHFEEEMQHFHNNASFLPFQFYPTEEDFYQLQYTALCKFGNPYFMQNFLTDFSRGEIGHIQRDKEMLSFIFDNNDYKVDQKEILEMLWGPQIVKEFFGRYQGLFIPGIESI